MRLRTTIAVALFAALVSGSASAGTGYGQIAFINQTSKAGDLYHNDAYGCYAQAGMVCMTNVRPGIYTVEARYRDGEIVQGANPIEVVEGQVSNFTVTEG
jgi:hypothetical protein